MKANTTSFTVAEYCDQMTKSTIVVNTDYQRTPAVWPTAARSYLIDTILLGFPIPKITLFQKTDLKSKITIKEIVDGQQRSNAILDFFNDNLRITGKSEFSGKRYSDLETDEQQRFVDYTLTADLLVGAVDEQVRQLFRRINSYTVPLNPQENRHATHQGDFKWFMVSLTEKYAQSLKDMGVLKEKQLSRMADAQLLTEITMAMVQGVATYSKSQLDKFYSDHDDSFEQKASIEKRFDSVFECLFEWESLHNSVLMKSGQFYSLCLAISHLLSPISALRNTYAPAKKGIKDRNQAQQKLSVLANALESDVPAEKYAKLRAAVDTATNTKKNRLTRFKWFCQAIDSR